jgi:hypothetical protein
MRLVVDELRLLAASAALQLLPTLPPDGRVAHCDGHGLLEHVAALPEQLHPRLDQRRVGRSASRLLLLHPAAVRVQSAPARQQRRVGQHAAVEAQPAVVQPVPAHLVSHVAQRDARLHSSRARVADADEEAAEASVFAVCGDEARVDCGVSGHVSRAANPPLGRRYGGRMQHEMTAGLRSASRPRGRSLDAGDVAAVPKLCNRRRRGRQLSQRGLTSDGCAVWVRSDLSWRSSR